jgi:hypothetical protein
VDSWIYGCVSGRRRVDKRDSLTYLMNKRVQTNAKMATPRRGRVSFAVVPSELFPYRNPRTIAVASASGVFLLTGHSKTYPKANAAAGPRRQGQNDEGEKLCAERLESERQSRRTRLTSWKNRTMNNQKGCLGIWPTSVRPFRVTMSVSVVSAIAGRGSRGVQGRESEGR